MREVNNLERIKNESNKGFTYAGIKNKSNFIKTLNRIKKLNNSVTKTNQNKDYWLIIDSYLEFLGGNIKGAELILSKVNSNELSEAKNVLTNVYKLHQWNYIRPKEEEHLATILDANIFFEDHYYRKNVSADWKHYFLEEVAHKYFEQGDLAKSFLLHNDYTEIGKVGSLELLNDIEKLNYKLTPNSFEKIILMQLKRADERSEIEFIHYLKGLLYLQNTEFDKAKIEFEKSTSFSSEKVVPRYVFNQNIIEAFWIKEYKKMTLFHADYYKNEIKNLMAI